MFIHPSINAALTADRQRRLTGEAHRHRLLRNGRLSRNSVPEPLSRRRRPRRRRPVAVVIGVAAATAASGTVDAVTCDGHVPAFPPGHWTAHGITFRSNLDDGISSGYLEGEFAFELDVSGAGVATGSYSGVLTGQLDGLTDSSSAGAVIIQHGEINGTGVLAVVDGTTGFDIDASIDVAGSDGIDIFTGGGSLYQGDVEFERPFTTTIAASQANCGEVVGNLSADDDAPAFFIATRTAPDTSDTDIAMLATEYLAATEQLNAAPLDPQQLAASVELGEYIDAAIAAQDACHTVDLDSLDRGGSTRNVLSLLISDDLHEYAERAIAGEYSTAELISVYTTAVRGGFFGGETGGCGTEGPAASGLRTAFERALIQRWSDAVESLDHVERLTVEAAAVQFGMTNLIETIGATP